MKKLNNKGFVLSETLVVSVFLMVLFTMIYTNFYPLIGEYEKRENYDDADGKYLAYWIKKMIESDGYILSTNEDDYEESSAEAVASAQRRIHSMNKYGYMRFSCKDVSTDNNQRNLCVSLVNSFEISGCDGAGDDCDIYITHYQIGTIGGRTITPDFKQTVRRVDMYKYLEYCTYDNDPAITGNDKNCKNAYYTNCCKNRGVAEGLCTDVAKSEDVIKSLSNTEAKAKENAQTIKEISACAKKTNEEKVFTSRTRDYILSLPNYTHSHASTGANYRVIIVRHHTRERNNYYSYSTMEVIK